MEHWEIEKNKADAKKALHTKYPELGKIVTFQNEYGVVLLSEDSEELCIRWDTNQEFDFEQYPYGCWGDGFKFVEKYEFKYINMDGTLK